MTTLKQTLEEIAKKNKGLEGEPLWTEGALEQDSVRRFIQAIMDNDPCYFDTKHAAHSKFGQLDFEFHQLASMYSLFFLFLKMCFLVKFCLFLFNS